MPRVAEPTELPQNFPWRKWEEELAKSPTGALVFDSSDFEGISPAKFRRKAKDSLCNVSAFVRGNEVVVILNA